MFAHDSNHQVTECVPGLNVFGGERTYPVLSVIDPSLWPINDSHISFRS